MAAVVLQGPAHAAPDLIVGPFTTLAEATDWSRHHPRHGGYSVAQELAEPEGAAGSRAPKAGLT